MWAAFHPNNKNGQPIGQLIPGIPVRPAIGQLTPGMANGVPIAPLPPPPVVLLQPPPPPVPLAPPPQQP